MMKVFFQIAMECLELSGRFCFIAGSFAELVLPTVVALL